MSHALSHTPSKELAKLANLLEKASHLARKLSRESDVSKPMTFSLPALKRPKHIPHDQEWFWTKEWQAGEREVDEALARGEYKMFNSVGEMLADLHARL